GHAAQSPDSEGLDTRPASRFLWCWIAVVLLVFSLARTKLPNYILPAYAPVSLLTARFLNRLVPEQPAPRWRLNLGLIGLALLGAALCGGLLLAGGAVCLPGLRFHPLDGLATWAFLGLLPAGGAIGAWWCLRRRQVQSLIIILVAMSTLLLGSMIACA